ncbi:hypothetical protein [Anaeromyxobacter sp. K]|uniref:hypothetical protein n=1 Tax=Anaeromyxobacter sp. (strain K) TaxID=447217 RepID=UPI0012FBC341|nr:hypothetical protein [Anaeromyxobacter sp. K]
MSVVHAHPLPNLRLSNQSYANMVLNWRDGNVGWAAASAVLWLLTGPTTLVAVAEQAFIEPVNATYVTNRGVEKGDPTMVAVGVARVAASLATVSMAARLTRPASEAAGDATRLLPQFTRSTVDDVIGSAGRLSPGGQITEGARAIAKEGRARSVWRVLVGVCGRETHSDECRGDHSKYA